jgi:hypothetical protein
MLASWYAILLAVVAEDLYRSGIAVNWCIPCGGRLLAGSRSGLLAPM